MALAGDAKDRRAGSESAVKLPAQRPVAMPVSFCSRGLYLFSGKAAAFTVSLGQRPRVLGKENFISAESAIQFRRAFGHHSGHATIP